MILILMAFAILMFYDLRRFIRKKENAKVYILYFFFMTVSLIVSLLLEAGRRPPGPSQWIQAALNLIGVLK